MNAPIAAGAKSRPKVDLDATVARLHRLGLMDAAEALPERMTRATKEALSVHHFLDQLLDVELSAREERRVKTELVPVRIAQRSNAGQLRLRLPALGGALAHRDTRHLRLGARQGD